MEGHFDASSGGANSTDLETWIDEVAAHSLLNEDILREVAGPTRVKLSGYWNCENPGVCDGPNDNHPLQYAYYDAIVVSSARVGCLGAQPTTSPPAQVFIGVRQ